MAPTRRADGAPRLGWDVGDATAHLRRDAPLARLMDAVGPFDHAAFARRGGRTPFEQLLRAIVYQQVSTRAADTVHARLLALFPGRRPSARRLLELDDAQLRGAGLSGVKVRYLRALGEAVRSRALPSAARLAAMPDDAIIDALTAIPGIGRWTAELLLLFHLGRPDVMPASDLGIRRGFRIMIGGTMLGPDEPVPAAEVAARAEARWRPYRSLAAFYLWEANYVTTRNAR